MKIESVDIKYHYLSGFSMNSGDGDVHSKSLPYMSIVQSQIGSYSIQLDNGPVYQTGDENFFIAPSVCTQKITHCLNNGLFKARYMFLDVVINEKYRFDDVFDMPVVVDKDTAKLLDKDFNDYENTDCIYEKMRCLYNIIKHLSEISTPKEFFQNDKIYPLIDFIKNNYQKNISISEMADILKISESNLYAVFKKSTGKSPIRYLNEYRLSVAAALLLQTSESIKTIAEKVGFEDQFYFSKLFKNNYHISPQKYRKEQY